MSLPFVLRAVRRRGGEGEAAREVLKQRRERRRRVRTPTPSLGAEGGAGATGSVGTAGGLVVHGGAGGAGTVRDQAHWAARGRGSTLAGSLGEAPPSDGFARRGWIFEFTFYMQQ